MSNLSPKEKLKLMIICLYDFDDEEVGNAFLETEIESGTDIIEILNVLEKHRPTLLRRLREGEINFVVIKKPSRTFVKSELEPLGFEFVREIRKSQMPYEVTMSYGYLELTFRCSCPAYPTIKAMGCPLHHEGPGGSMTVDMAKKIPTS